MAGIDDVLERLITDDRFREQLATDPGTALAGYELTPADRALLGTQVTADAGQSGALEARASKAGLFGLLGGLDEFADAIVAGDGVASDAPLQPPQSDLDMEREPARQDGISYQNTFQAIPDEPAVPLTGEESLAAAPTEPERVGWPVKWELSELDASAAGAAPPVEDATEAIETAEPPIDPDSQVAWTAIALAESGGNTETPSATGGTMSTDDWDDQGSAVVPELTERAIGGGPGADEPGAAGGEDSTGLGQINGAATKTPDAEAAGDGVSMRPWTVTHAGMDPQSTDDEKITIHGQHDLASGAETAGGGSADAAAEPRSAHVAISLGDGETVEAEPPGADTGAVATPDAPSPPAYDPDPDAFDVSELTQWATGSGSAATDGLDAAGADDEATPPPAPDD